MRAAPAASAAISAMAQIAPYSTGIIYSPMGGMTKEQFGTDTALYNKSFYNSRGQLAEIRVGTYHATDGTWRNRGAIINHSNNCWGMCSGRPVRMTAFRQTKCLNYYFSVSLSLKPPIITVKSPASTTGLFSIPINEKSSRFSLNVKVLLCPASR